MEVRCSPSITKQLGEDFCKKLVQEEIENHYKQRMLILSGKMEEVIRKGLDPNEPIELKSSYKKRRIEAFLKMKKLMEV